MFHTEHFPGREKRKKVEKTKDEILNKSCVKNETQEWERGRENANGNIKRERERERENVLK